MRCPRCESSVLEEKERDGIVVDACLECRGIWLDRGELEKLTARARRETEDELGRASYRAAGEYRAGSAHDRRHPYRKRSWVESLSDLFE